MIRFFLLCTPFLLISQVASAQTHLEVAVELSRAIVDKNFFQPKSLSNYRALNAALKERICSHTGTGGKSVRVRYRHVMLGDSVYVLGIYKKRAVLSKHFKYRVEDNQAVIDSLTESSETCIHLHFSHPLFVFGSGEGWPALYPIEESERLSPNEMQVFVSFFNGQKLNVHTRIGDWRIRDGETTFNMQTTKRTQIDGDRKDSLTQCHRVSVPDDLKLTLEAKRAEYFDVCLACEGNQCKFREKITHHQLVPCARLFCKAVSGTYPGLDENVSHLTHRLIDYQYSIQQDGTVRIDSIQDSHSTSPGASDPEVLEVVNSATKRMTYAPVEREGKRYEITGLRNFLTTRLSAEDQ